MALRLEFVPPFTTDPAGFLGAIQRSGGVMTGALNPRPAAPEWPAEALLASVTSGFMIGLPRAGANPESLPADRMPIAHSFRTLLGISLFQRMAPAALLQTSMVALFCSIYMDT